MTITRNIGDDGANVASLARAAAKALSSSGREISSGRPEMPGSRDGASLLRLIGTGAVHEISEVRIVNTANTRVSIGSNEKEIGHGRVSWQTHLTSYIGVRC